MGQNTKIQWTDHTFNPWRGCTKVSPGCANCYAETLSKRNPKLLGEWGPGRPRVLASDEMWRELERWNNYLTCDCGTVRVSIAVSRLEPEPCPVCRSAYRRPRVFCASLADWLDDADVVIDKGKETERIDLAGVGALADLLDLIRRTPNLDWLLLTKRPENWRTRLTQAYLSLNRGPISEAGTWAWLGDWLGARKIPENVWLGVSAENQEYWDERVPVLLSIPAKVRFVSVEPMLGPINMGLLTTSREPICDKEGAVIDYRLHSELVSWVIFGGESGPKARPCNADWIRDGVRQCREAGVAAFVKQLGERTIDTPPGKDPPWMASKVVWTRGWKDRKGGDPAEWPEDLRVREFPAQLPTCLKTHSL